MNEHDSALSGSGPEQTMGAAGPPSDLPRMVTEDEIWAWIHLDGARVLSRNDAEWVLGRVGRETAPRVFRLLYGEQLLSPEARGLVGSVWSGAEFPDRCMSREEWLELFEAAGYCEDGVPAERPSGPVRLYRGSIPERRNDWSWTDNLEVARKYARGGWAGRPVGTVWVADVPSGQLLCRNVAERQEDEYVVNTDGLVIEEWVDPLSD